MKKSLLLVVAMMMLILLIACGNTDSNNKKQDDERAKRQREPLPIDVEKVEQEYKSADIKDSNAKISFNNNNIIATDANINEVDALLQSISLQLNSNDITDIPTIIKDNVNKSDYFTKEFIMDGLTISVVAVEENTITIKIFKESD